MCDRFVVDASGPDITLAPTNCTRLPCTCTEKFRNVDCGMTVTQAQEFVAQYYQLKSEYVRGMTPEHFLLDYAGIYP